MHTNPPTVGRPGPFLGGKSHYVVFLGSYVIYVSNNPCAEIIEKTKGRINKFPGWRPRPPRFVDNQGILVDPLPGIFSIGNFSTSSLCRISNAK
jgi:hypothetical protein